MNHTIIISTHTLIIMIRGGLIHIGDGSLMAGGSIIMVTIIGDLRKNSSGDLF